MTDEKKKDPTWKLGDLEPLKPAKVKLLSARPIATGDNKYGTWALWLGNVENQKVTEKESGKVITNYSGDIVFFPSEKLNKALLEATGGKKVDTVVEIAMVPKKSPKGGLYTTYEVRLITEGTIPAEDVSYSHTKYMEDFEKIAEKNIVTRNKDSFVMIGQQPPHNIPKNTLEDLWAVYAVKHNVK